MFINDFPEVVKSSECLLFADDAKIFKEIESERDCLDLQLDINSILKWCSRWKINFNLDKCYFLNFTLK